MVCCFESWWLVNSVVMYQSLFFVLNFCFNCCLCFNAFVVFAGSDFGWLRLCLGLFVACLLLSVRGFCLIVCVTFNVWYVDFGLFACCFLDCWFCWFDLLCFGLIAAVCLNLFCADFVACLWFV